MLLKEKNFNTRPFLYHLKFSTPSICKPWVSKIPKPCTVCLCGPWLQIDALCVKWLLHGGEKCILFYSLGWFSLTNAITIKLNLCFFGEASDMWLIIGLLIWRFMGGKMLIFFFFFFLLNVKLRDKTYNVHTWKRDVQIPYILLGKFHCINGLLFVDGKIKLTGIPNSPIVPVNWGISVLGKLSELLN